MPKAPELELDSPLTAEQELNRIAFKRAVNRRRFLAGLGMAGAATAAGAGLLAGCSSSGSSSMSTMPVTAAGPAPQDVLNFALNLEYLEASFYLIATTGSGLSTADMGTGTGLGTVMGGGMTNFTDPKLAALAAIIANDEKTHVEFLRTAIGGISGATVSAMPQINLDALGAGLMKTQLGFVLMARAFEDVGVSAYGGAAQYLGGTAYLTPAAQILGMEAYHASAIRQYYINNNLTGAAALDSQDVVPTAATPFDDNNALVVVRTTSQVLQIAYAATTTGVTKGGFYPNGLNGAITTT